MTERLTALSRRIEALLVDGGPGASVWNRAIAPLLRAFEWRPTLQTEAIEALLDGLQDGKDTERLHAAALEEAERNIAQVERASVVAGCPPIAHASWLWRCYQVLARARARSRLHPALSWHRVAALPPLMVDVPDTQDAVHVDSVDPLLAAAADEGEFLDRRRRLLEAARQLLLDTAAALPVESDGVRQRQRYIAEEISRINRLQAAGLDPGVGLVHQARQALTRGDAQRLHAALVALDEAAARRGGGGLARLTAQSLETLWQDASRHEESASERSLERSAEQLFKPEVRNAIYRGYDKGRGALQEELRTKQDLELERTQTHLRYLKEGNEKEAILAALNVDGCFEVGGVGTPVRVFEETRRLRAVPFPTQDLVLLPARGVSDIPSSIVSDPRAILMDLAAGRLLARRYVAEEIRRRPMTKLSTEVRVYILDGSGSMLGPRARMRDSILIAELATLMERLSDADRVLSPVLYYRYFTKKIWPTTRVVAHAEAVAAIENVTARVWSGGTDIENALIASFAQIRDERRQDPHLARAQIVLVTDGEAPVDPEKILAARAEVGDVPVGVSIIALGEENPALRSLAAAQRAAGESVFYHFVDDATLTAAVLGRSAGLPVHLPHDIDLSELKAELDGLLTEMEAITRAEHAPALEEVEVQVAALAEVGLTLEGTGEALAAQRAAAVRDIEAVWKRFDRWFPAEPSEAGVVVTPAGDEARAVDLVIALLGSTAEVVELTDSVGVQRPVDAIEIFERLMVDAGVSPWRYAELGRRYEAMLRPGIDAVRGAARVPGSRPHPKMPQGGGGGTQPGA